MSEREVAMRRENILALEGTPVLAERARPMTVEEFLDFAECREERYEFINGEICPMTGGKLNHFRIITNLMDLLLFRLPPSEYTRFSAGMLIRAGDETLLSPDVMVVSSQPETEANTRILLNPALVVEVTSPTSRHYDRGAKRDFYFDVPSIQAYLIVEQERPLVELHTRGRTGWQIRSSTGMDDDAPLDALDCRLPLREIYKGIGFVGESADAP